MMQFLSMITRIIERHPSSGYAVSAMTTGIGALNIMAHIQALLGIISLLIGITVGIITLRIQLRKLREPHNQTDEESGKDS